MTRIFLVDDEDSIRKTIQKALSTQKLDVSAFRSPLDALAEISTEPPDLLISDDKMPDMTGLELAEAAREKAADLPVILITRDPSATDKEKVNALGIVHVLMKPVDEFDELWSAIRCELSWNDARDTVRELDQIRMEFFTDLSHKLRTPLTAMTLAVEGLFSHFRSVMSPSQRELAKVSRRNIDRIVKLVENQLDLLQIMVGESRISRRLIDLNGLVRSIPTRVSGDEWFTDGVSIDIRSNEREERPMYVFTDPAPLATIIDCLLGGGPSKIRRELRLEFDPADQCYRLDIELDYMGVTGHSHDDDVGAEDRGMPRLDFECRAYNSLLGQLGGEVVMKKDTNHKRIWMRLPRYPVFDRHKDFLNPVRVLRSSTEENGQNVSFIRCELGDGIADDYLEGSDRQSRDFLNRVESILSEGDAVLRGRQHRTLYLALTERSQQELDHVKSFLDEHRRDERNASSLYVSKPQTIVQDYGEIIELTKDLELV